MCHLRIRLISYGFLVPLFLENKTDVYWMNPSVTWEKALTAQLYTKKCNNKNNCKKKSNISYDQDHKNKCTGAI